MNDWADILRNVFGLAAIIAAGVAAAFYGTVRTLRSAIDDRDKRIEGLEGRVTDLESNLATEKAEHVVTRGDLAALRRVVTGEAHWVAIESQIDSNHRAVTSTLDRILAALLDRKRPPDARD